jgi:hypothetical protein
MRPIIRQIPDRTKVERRPTRAISEKLVNASRRAPHETRSKVDRPQGLLVAALFKALDT